MTVEQLPEHLKHHWPGIREQLLSGTYRPQPVKRVEIPKPEGGVRKLGIPTVLDRFIQQAVMQVLQRRWDRTFSEHSYGFRPGRSAHQAVSQAQQYIAGGYRWVVDLDLEKFFDRVNHDRLMAKIAERVSDKRLLRLIRAFLCAGVMENGLVSPVDEGTPQGGPLSPLLSNIVLDELDRELERRGQRPCRQNGRQCARSVAALEQPGPHHGTAQCLLRLARDTKVGCQPITQPAEPPGTDPYAGWCDRESWRQPTYVEFPFSFPALFPAGTPKITLQNPRFLHQR
jgi:group II intron reverse transcriptase/maturase